MMKLSHLCFALLILVGGCQQPHTVHRAFYYWKTAFSLSNTEKQALQQTATQKLYVKFFDVLWNPVTTTAMPVAKVQINTTDLQWLQQHHIPVIPVVFITNESLQQTPEEKILTIADNLSQLLSAQLEQYALTTKEIQVDCDWTAGTRDKYFKLLRRLREQPLLNNKQIILSATIRLYQCKYRTKTGVPPVDRGLLMCYNMGNLKDPATKNSILETDELKKYIGSLNTYPLPLDAAFPLFDWKVLYRNNIYSGLIQTIPDDTLKRQPFVQVKGNRFFITTDTTWKGYMLNKGDILRSETSNLNEIIDAATALRKKWQTQDFTVSLFHLDSLVLTKYPSYELEKIFTVMQ
ncbi:MAG: hypothetical protein QM731_23205 [Chitinophagaceae bacterium]